MKCYNIEHQNEYGIELSRVVDLEDVGDEFLTQAELDDMGLERTYGFMLYTAKVRRECKKWIAKIPEGKTSIKCTDVELIDALKRNFLDRSTSMQMILGKKYVGVTRSGSIFKRKPKTIPPKGLTRAPRMSDWFKLMNLAQEALAASGIYISGGKLSKDVPDRKQTLTSLKKIIRWDDMVAANKEGWYNSYYENVTATKEEMKLIKNMWRKSELVVKFNKRKT